MVDFRWIANNLGYESLIHTTTRVWDQINTYAISKVKDEIDSF